MPHVDLTLEELQAYNPRIPKENDFDSFWDDTLTEALKIPLDTELVDIDYPVDAVRAYKVYYRGWRGSRMCGWYLCPRGGGPHPGLLVIHGYSGSKGEVCGHLAWALQGYGVFAIDVRGQAGESQDTAIYSSGHVKGWMTKGILDHHEYYYRGVYMDCIKAIELLASRPEVDPARIGVMGRSQGGGLSLVIASLVPRIRAPFPARGIKTAMAAVPYLSHFKRGVDLAEAGPFLEISDYLRFYPGREQKVFRTLSYFDVANMAENVECPVLMSVGLQDLICPPSTVFAAYNRLKSEKRLLVYSFSGHEASEVFLEEEIKWAKKHLGTSGL